MQIGMKMQIRMKIQGSNSLYFSFSWVFSPPFLLQYYIFIIIIITNYPNSLVSIWSWSCLKVSMGFTPILFIYLQFNWVCLQADKISNSSIGLVLAMAEVDTLSQVVLVLTDILNPGLVAWKILEIEGK